MRPLFAIAPLALVLALLGPTSQASQPERSWSQTLMSWAFDQDDDGRASGQQHAEAPSSLRALIDRVIH